MEGRIVHYQHRLWLRPSATVMEDLLDEVLENNTICISLEHVLEECHPVSTQEAADQDSAPSLSGGLPPLTSQWKTTLY